MSLNPPQGSRILINTINGHQCISVPHGDGGVMKYFIAAFLLFWLGGWFMGFTSAAEKIITGEGSTFLIFWLGGWSLGGIFAAYFIFRIFRISIPEKLLLNKPYLSLDTGIPPFKMDFGITNHKDYWKTLFPKRKKIEFTKSELQSIQLRETDTGNRLTIDKGSERIDIATSATEIEREWLCKQLQLNYS